MLADAMVALEPSFAQAGLFDQGSVAVIPVPMYKAKRRQRGFNQAELIAPAALRFFPARQRLQLVPDLLLRTRDTHSQIGLTGHQRRENLRGAFAVARAAEVTGRRCFWWMMFTGRATTVTECARALRRAGARQVWVTTVARTRKLASNYVEHERVEDSEEDLKVSESQGVEVGA
jgi:predicted amidophosphoribosyltransferase